MKVIKIITLIFLGILTLSISSKGTACQFYLEGRTLILDYGCYPLGKNTITAIQMEELGFEKCQMNFIYKGDDYEVFRFRKDSNQVKFKNGQVILAEINLQDFEINSELKIGTSKTTVFSYFADQPELKNLDSKIDTIYIEKDPGDHDEEYIFQEDKLVKYKIYGDYAIWEEDIDCNTTKKIEQN